MVYVFDNNNKIHEYQNVARVIWHGDDSITLVYDDEFATREFFSRDEYKNFWIIDED